MHPQRPDRAVLARPLGPKATGRGRYVFASPPGDDDEDDGDDGDEDELGITDH